MDFSTPISLSTVRSERVNALRKQYDAFLEEDKKRKERNEFILGRLDNMRYSTTAALQIRHKSGVYADMLPVYSRVAYRPDQFERREIPIPQTNTQQIIRTNNQNLQLDVPRPYLDDTPLLKEISKKYILIPKLRSSLINDYVGIVPSQSLPSVAVSSQQMNISGSEDWKSKYDILEQLKNNEKEEKAVKLYKDELSPVKENQMKDNSSVIDGNDLQGYNTKEYTTKYEQEVPEKDLTFDKFELKSEHPNLEKSKIYDSKDQEPTSDHTPIRADSNDVQPEINTAYDNTFQNQDLEHNTPVQESVIYTSNIAETALHSNNDPVENGTISEYNYEEPIHAYDNSEHQVNEEPQQEEYPVEYEQLDADGSKFPDPENVYLDQDDYSPIQVMNPTELVDEIHRENPTVTETKEDEVLEYPVDMINVQEFTPIDDVKLEDGVNVNPVYLASEENVEPLYENNLESQPIDTNVEEQPIQQTDNSGIEAFDAEHREMFYSDDTDAYAYEQQQQAAGESFTPGYAPTEGYQQPQAQDYTYYEGSAELQEQEYPVEINEHDETASRYDQNYEQQYATGYEQQAYDPGQEPQQYDLPVEGYDQTQQQYQEYEYQQPEHETVQNVEQVLDNEQGFYAETQNLESNQGENIVEQQAAE